MKQNLLTEKQAAEYLEVSPRYLQYKRAVGGGPKFVKLSHRCVRYTQASLDDHVALKIVGSTSSEN